MAKLPSSRLDFKQDALFSGSLIDRERPISFTLDGRQFNGFAGDSVLSALLASGIDCVGELEGEPIALDESLCPPVVMVSGDGVEGRVLPMDRTPVLDGMELKTHLSAHAVHKVKRSAMERLKRGLSGLGQTSLDIDLSSGEILPGPWVDQPAEREFSTDLLVIGGGVTGLSAALAGARNGRKVMLVERRSELGGDARFFGSLEGEQRPDQFIQNLREEIGKYQNVEIFCNAEVLSLAGSSARVFRVFQHKGSARGEMVRLTAKKVILATGTIERLPVFPGNRLPGVAKARSLFHLAANYGVWRGRNAAFCTSSSAATQVALLAADMGVKISKLADSRTRPKSRFFEFAKAYGISLVTGTQVASASLGPKGCLSVQFGLTANASMQTLDALNVDSLVVCGGWQPDLMLWHAAGGHSLWDKQSNQLQGAGELDDVALAGSCAGALSMSACANHGQSVFFAVSGVPANGEMLRDPDREHESDDGELPVVRAPEGAHSCFLDTGYTFAKPEPPSRSGMLGRIFKSRAKRSFKPEGVLNVYTLGEVVAKVGLGEIPGEYAGIIAQERCIHAGRFSDAAASIPDTGAGFTQETHQVPDYLVGRFGKNAKIVGLGHGGASEFEIGCQIYLDSETDAPIKAIGAVVDVGAGKDGQSLAYMDVSALKSSHSVVVRNDTHMVTVSVIQHVN